ncbi:MAG: agmatinase [Candidatus Parvarchaeota archaeon]|nr:agmatinase [Candidatus Parvarchaeota archaeon]
MLLYESKDSFLEETIELKKAKYILLPVPMDITTTYLKGTKFGPRSIIEASRSIENYNAELNFDVRDLIYTAGELEIPPDAQKAVEVIRKTVSDVLMENKFPIIVGGEHTITYGASLAFDKDVIFIIFDAHADFKKDVFGSEINHASNSRLINRRNKIILIGVRSLSLEEKNELKKNKIPVFYAYDQKIETNIKGLFDHMKGKQVYVSIDMDVFDPSVAPGVGTPQPGGMLYQTVKFLLEKIAKNSKIVGFDVNEVRPLGENNITEILAAKLIVDMIALSENNKK